MYEKNITLTYLSILKDFSYASIRKLLEHNFEYQKASILKALSISTEDLNKSFEIEEE